VLAQQEEKMGESTGGYQVMPVPAARRLVIDGGRLATGRHAIHGLIEVDVTLARAYMREHKARTGESLSFTAFVIACLGQAVDRDPRVHACRDWRNRLVIFDEVNVNTMFSAEGTGRQAHLVHVIKAVNKRPFREIHDEIRAFQMAQGKSPEGGFIDSFVRLPWPMRRLFYWAILHTPRWQHEYFGTVAVSAVGMFGNGGGWGLPFTNHSLTVTVGGIARKPGVVDDRIEIREYLDLTLSFDHDLVDGAPAARFAQHFKELLEAGSGLC
jgi:pyruvate/2-oxoglutarate dehydrogenase complex dihydrolipoamide acyltransferase (E2) component